MHIIAVHNTRQDLSRCDVRDRESDDMANQMKEIERCADALRSMEVQIIVHVGQRCKRILS